LRWDEAAARAAPSTPATGERSRCNEEQKGASFVYLFQAVSPNRKKGKKSPCAMRRRKEPGEENLEGASPAEGLVGRPHGPLRIDGFRLLGGDCIEQVSKLRLEAHAGRCAPWRYRHGSRAAGSRRCPHVVR
jgi:hypothetical protein